MIYLFELLSAGLVSFIFSLFLVPLFRKLAVKIQLVDAPSHRKLHQSSIPLIGGIIIALSVMLSMLISPSFINSFSNYLPLFSTASLLLFMGVLDDKFDIKAKYKLVIQVACAYSIALSGTRITSMYGVFGIHEIAPVFQYLLTIIVITGVVNAFNLMDGIDGLAGGLSLFGFVMLTVVALFLGNRVNALLYLSFIGALLGFLKFNLTANKIFMGDAGSLLLGFVLIVSGIQTLESTNSHVEIKQSLVLFLIVGFFCVPVLDSLRVYLTRIKRGNSPFKADRSHIHHLFLFANLSHKKISLLINFLILGILIVSGISCYFFSETFVLLVILIGFYLLTKLLGMNKNLAEWKNRIRKLENE